MRFVLASASPARRNLLRAAGIDADIDISGVDESTVDSEKPRETSQRLARHKARTVAARHADGLVLGCDSVLELDGEALGKPGTAAEARRRWRAMRGRAGILHTGHCLIDTSTGKSAEATASTTVRFADVSDAEIDAYVATGEPLHVAGAFTIDGLGGPFVESVDGDPGTVIGLSLPLLRHLLADLGIQITDLWRDQLASGT